MRTLKFYTVAFTFLFFSLMVFPLTTYASKKAEVKKQIEGLNQKLKEAGDKGDLQTAIDTAEQVMDLSSKEFGDKSVETAKAMNNVANLYMYADHAADAERLYKSAILIQMKRTDPKSPEMADSFYNLAMAYAVQKKYDEARKMLDKCYKIRVERLGESHADTQKARKALDEIWNESTSA